MIPAAQHTVQPDTLTRGDADTDPTARAALAILAQCAAFVARIPDEVYTRASASMHGSTIGQHVRHTLDHLTAALRALDGAEIDYDHRRRDTPVETSRDEALREIDRRSVEAARVTRDAARRDARVRVMLSAEGDEMVLGSTLGRELAFATHHAVHHHAMISAIASEFGVPVPPGFGKAPATLHHERARNA